MTPNGVFLFSATPVGRYDLIATTANGEVGALRSVSVLPSQVTVLRGEQRRVSLTGNPRKRRP